MTKRFARRLACGTFFTCVAIAAIVAAQPVVSAEDEAPEGKTATKPEKKKAAKGRHRLPPLYGDVVDDEQREKIYKIQDEFQPKIDALRAELKALTQERDAKIEALLTPEQKRQIAEAKAKRQAARLKAKKPAEEAAPPSQSEPKP